LNRSSGAGAKPNEGRRTAARAPGKVAEKAELPDVEMGKVASPEKALVQIHTFLEVNVQKSRKP